METSIEKRAMGAIVGAFIGDALALGPHWYYDLDEQRREYGEWVDTYTAPRVGRYHEGLKAGDQSQSGYILKLMIKSILENNGYDHGEFCNKLDKDLFTKIDGTAFNGPGGYTSQSIREAYKQRVTDGKDWKYVVSFADTTEALERTLALSVVYAGDFKELAHSVAQNTYLTQKDEIVGAMGVAYGSVLALLIQGQPLDENISKILMGLVKKGDLPFHATTGDNLTPDKKSKPVSKAGSFSSPDALLTPSNIATIAKDPKVQIEPAWKVSQVYGMPCAIYHVLPAAYYLASRFNDDFESAVLHAVNGGGQNQARAILTGALVGAQVGIDEIPAQFIQGLNEGKEILTLAKALTSISETHQV